MLPLLRSSERHRSPAPKTPDLDVAAEAAEFGAERYGGAVAEARGKAAGGTCRPAVDERSPGQRAAARQRDRSGVVAGEVIIGVDAGIGRDRQRGIEQPGIGDGKAGRGAAGEEATLGLRRAQRIRIGALLPPPRAPPPRPPDGPALHLIDLAIAPAARHRGMGSDVIISLVRAGHALGARHFTLAVLHSNDAARRLYGRLGFSSAADGVYCAMVRHLE